MHPMDGLAGVMEWAGPDLAYNLDFLPEDRLNWRPAPDARSALAVAAEAAWFTHGMIRYFRGEPYEFTVPESPEKEEVQEKLRTGAAEYAAVLRGLPVEKLGDMVTMEFGTFPLGVLAGFPVIEVVHHRGQVCYIQTILGDTESHFLM